MSRTTLPPVNPEKTFAGIAVDPKTLERVIPESRRLDGSIRKEIKIRPGFTPQEDVKRFRGTKQTQMEVNQLPKGHILGWVAPSASTNSKSTGEGSKSATTKSASKNAKRNAKKKEQKEQKHLDKIRDNWENSDEETPSPSKSAGKAPVKGGEAETGAHTQDKPDATTTLDAEGLAEELEKLDVKG